MKKTQLALAITLMASGSAYATSFVNGAFETGDTSGWTTGAGRRTVEYNNTIAPSHYLPGGSYYSASLNHSAVVSAGVAPHTDGQLNQVYSGNYSFRAEDTSTGGYASAITQTVTNYTDNSIYFAWAAVLEGAHGVDDAATFQLTLTDITTNELLVNRSYNAANGGSGVDSRFTLSSDGYFYTAWQIENLDVSARNGHTFELSLLAADCQQTGHAGYVYLDGFGSVLPPPVIGNVPEPATLALLGAGFLGFRRMKRYSVKA